MQMLIVLIVLITNSSSTPQLNSFSKMLLQKEELEQKHLHLVQIVESEKTAKFTYTQQVEDLSIEV